MKRPWLIQRCNLENEKLTYELMGSTEFEIGDQAKALKRIFSVGIETGSVSVNFRGKELAIYIVAAKGFIFDDYKAYLQQLLDEKLRLKNPALFNWVVMEKLGFQTSLQDTIKINVWFDIENDVLWALTEIDQKALVVTLEEIKKKWSVVK